MVRFSSLSFWTGGRYCPGDARRLAREFQVGGHFVLPPVRQDLDVLERPAAVSRREDELAGVLEVALRVQQAGRALAEVVEVRRRLRGDGVAPPVLGLLADLHDPDAVAEQ